LYLEQPRESTLLNGFKLKHVIERQILLMKTKPVSVQRIEEINLLESLSEANLGAVQLILLYPAK